MVRPETDEHPQWEACAAGTISQMQSRLRAKQRRRTTVRVLVPIATVALLWIGIGQLGGDLDSPSLQPTVFEADQINFVCTDVRANLEPYLSDELSPSKRRAFMDHLADCPVCTKWVRDMSIANASASSPIRRINPKLMASNSD